MQDLHIHLQYDDEGGRGWHVGAIVRADGRIELCREETCSPFAGYQDLRAWVVDLLDVWANPQLLSEPSEGLHDVFSQHP